MNTTSLKSAFSLKKHETPAGDADMTIENETNKRSASSESESGPAREQQPEADVSMHGVADPPTPIKRRSYLSKRLSLQTIPRPQPNIESLQTLLRRQTNVMP